MHFSLLPAGGEDTASSRIRVYTMQHALETMGIPVTMGYSDQASTLYVQKKVTARVLWLTRWAVLQGKKVIYDVDDLGDALWYWVSKGNFSRMLRLADLVTTASARQMAMLTEMQAVAKEAVVLPAIDYYPTAPVRVPPAQRENLRIIWFGNGGTASILDKYLDVLLTIPKVEVTIMGNARVSREYAARYPSVRVVPWSMADFVPTLQSCDLTCLMHDGSQEDHAKSNNRMIASITWGVPAIVSRTAEYERTAREAGVEYCVFANEQELRAVVEKLRADEARTQYLDTAQPIIWDLYSPVTIAKEYVRLAAELSATQTTFRQRLARVFSSF